jgi:MFS superfamily sulfate permease-like transporter
MAGLYSALVVGVTSVAFGDSSTTVYAPRVTTTFILGGLLYHLVNSGEAVVRSGGAGLILLAFYAIILLAGAFQALFGLIRLGTLLRFTPHPVMAGFQNAAAALLFLVQLGNVSGFEKSVSFMHFGSHWHEIKPLSVGVALLTFLVMWNAKKLAPKVPPLLLGLGVGSVVYFLLIAAGLSADLGPVIGISDTSPQFFDHLKYLPAAVDIVPLLPTIVGGALALALVAALDALLCANLATPGAGKSGGNQLLVRLGLGNMFAAGAGGITSGINIGASVANRAFGGKTPASVLINAGVLLVVVLVALPVVSLLPRAVLSACVMVIAVQHIDPWSIELVRRIRTHAARHRGLMLLDLFMVGLVALMAVTLHIVAAVFLGVVVAITMFVVRMSRSNIRRAYRCDTIHSRRARRPDDIAVLERRGGEILVLELQGPLFFGSAEMLSRDVELRAAHATRIVILDLRRVTEIDATGAQILAEISTGLARKQQTLAIALARKSESGHRLHEAGVLETIGPGHAFEDVDRAIEWAEDSLLAGAAGGASPEHALADVDLLRDLTAAELALVTGLVQRASYRAGERIFRQGEPGRELFIVTQGRASAYLDQPDGGRVRLATFATGTAFGELAILDAGPRSATVIADENIVCCKLTTDDFAQLAKTAPDVAIKLLTRLGRELSGRLRRANRTIHELES